MAARSAPRERETHQPRTTRNPRTLMTIPIPANLRTLMTISMPAPQTNGTVNQKMGDPPAMQMTNQITLTTMQRIAPKKLEEKMARKMNWLPIIAG